MKNVDSMRAQAESAFVQVLKQELEKKCKTLKTPYITYSRVGMDTIPQTVYISTANGKKKYDIDMEKSLLNLSHSFAERTKQSLCLADNPLSADTISQYWLNLLVDYRIFATVAVENCLTDLEGNVSCMESNRSKNLVSSQFRFVSYIGNRCETEIIGKLKYTWWAVYFYYWYPFAAIVVVLSVVLSLIFYSFKLKNKPHPVEYVEKEVIREKVYTVKEVGEKRPDLYSFNNDLLFDPRKQLLIYKGIEIKLSPQSVVILKYFLDAPDNTATGDELVRDIWGGNHGATINNFRSASQRIYIAFAQTNVSIKFVRVGINKYMMVYHDKQ